MNIFTIALLVLTPFLVWRVYSRLRTALARQRSIVSRHWTGLLVFAAMLLVTASEVVSNLPMLGWLGVGTAAGVAYGVWAFRKTRLETREGYYYTQPARLGIVIAMLFTARVLYVGFELYANQGTSAPVAHFTDSMLTMLVVGLTGGYFGTMCAGLALWRYKVRKAIGQVEET